MRSDNEGFWYPEADKNVCIECHLCEKVCPFLNQGASRKPQAVYAAKNPDEAIRQESSSGGIFSMLAERIIDEGGVVFGACFDKQWNVVHDCVSTKNELFKFRGSKYVQSKIGETYKKAEIFLKENRKVLFSGTPCQIAGLRKFLRTDYDNLLTVDFICHGVPSPGVFRTYLQEEIGKVAARQGCKKNTVLLPRIPLVSERDGLYGKDLEIKSISFRDKRNGWKKYGFALTLSKASAAGEKNSVLLSYSPLTKNLFLRGFLKNIYLRPSCYACKTRDFRSGSDMTLADFWGIGKLNRSLDDDKGMSMLIVNSKRGLDYSKSVCDETCRFSENEVRRFNPAAYYSCVEPTERKTFFTMGGSVHQRMAILARPTLRERTRSFLKTIVRDFLRIKA